MSNSQVCRETTQGRDGKCNIKATNCTSPLSHTNQHVILTNTIQIQELGFIQFWMTSCWQRPLMGVECTKRWVVFQSMDTFFDIGRTS